VEVALAAAGKPIVSGNPARRPSEISPGMRLLTPGKRPLN